MSMQAERGRHSRRQFLADVGIGALAAGWTGVAQAQDPANPPQQRAARPVAKLQPFDMADVTLEDGPFLHAQHMTEKYLLGLVRRLQPGVTEIYCHPGMYVDTELERWGPAYHRQKELAALLSPRLRELLTAAGIDQSDFRELSRRAAPL